MASRSQQSSAKATLLVPSPPVVAANLEAIGAPTAVALIYCNPTVVPPLNAANVAIEQEAVDLHHAVDPFVIGRLADERPKPVS